MYQSSPHHQYHQQAVLKSRALPRSADPSPHRTTRRIEAIRAMSASPSAASGTFTAVPAAAVVSPTASRTVRTGSPGAVSTASQYFRNHPEMAAAVHNREKRLQHRELHRRVGDAMEEQASGSADGRRPDGRSVAHQVLYVCHGHCSGPECEFTQSIRHWQSLVRLGDGQCFRSEVVEKAPLSLVKLEEKRQSLGRMKEVLAGKLESKQRHRERKEERQRQRRRSASKSPASASGGGGGGGGANRGSSASQSPVSRETQTPTPSASAAPQSSSLAPLAHFPFGSGGSVGSGGGVAFAQQLTAQTPEKRPASSATNSTLSEQGMLALNFYIS